MFKRTIFLSLFALATLFVSASAQNHNMDKGTKFTVRIENVSSADGQVAKDGTKWPFALSPGLWVLHKREVRLFREGVAANGGLEELAESGNPGVLVKNLEARGHDGMDGVMLHGVFNTPVGGNGPAPIGPGGAYEFTFTAEPGMRLSLATMFGQSNDWFYAPKRQGVDLFKNGKALSGDITNEFMLFDAGTEKDEEPGVGPNQGPRQKDPNAGEAENGKVHPAKTSSFFTRNGELFKVTITPDSAMAKM
ncbi:MAG: spondin domain-containing protein [Acidobacteria bacterium]|nr:spondin domain-containing protein [Acidobacteriota bacterium]